MEWILTKAYAYCLQFPQNLVSDHKIHSKEKSMNALRPNNLCFNLNFEVKNVN